MQNNNLEQKNPFSPATLVWMQYIGAKPGTVCDYPYNKDAMSFKVCHKLFAVITNDKTGNINISLKCDPDYAIKLRKRFVSIVPGRCMNKKNWNTLILSGELTEGEIRQQIDASYILVLQALSPKPIM